MGPIKMPVDMIDEKIHRVAHELSRQELDNHSADFAAIVKYIGYLEAKVEGITVVRQSGFNG